MWKFVGSLGRCVLAGLGFFDWLVGVFFLCVCGGVSFCVLWVWFVVFFSSLIHARQ